MDERGIPTLKPQHCRHPGCGSVITSSMYVGRDDTVICETCYRRHYLNQSGFSKVYKHSALDDVMTPVLARRICKCTGVAWNRGDKPAELYPVDPADGHLDDCGLLKLGRVEAKAKYGGLRAVAGGSPGATTKLLTREDSFNKKPSSTRRRLSSVFGSSRSTDVRAEVPEPKGVVSDPAEDMNIPESFRKFADKNAFSHVHMAVRVGPLVIENGAGK